MSLHVQASETTVAQVFSDIVQEETVLEISSTTEEMEVDMLKSSNACDMLDISMCQLVLAGLSDVVGQTEADIPIEHEGHTSLTMISKHCLQH